VDGRGNLHTPLEASEEEESLDAVNAEVKCGNITLLESKDYWVVYAQSLLLRQKKGLLLFSSTFFHNHT
jgi:hypothetical protein